MANKLTRVHIEGVPIPRCLDDTLQAGAWYQQRTKQRKAWLSGRFVVPDKTLRSYRFSGSGFKTNFKFARVFFCLNGNIRFQRRR
jgi:hypothetical protein